MNIVVCIKQVPYPDTPASAYGVDEVAKRVSLPNDVPLVINPFDENAVEAGLQLKDKVGGKMTVISLATNPAPDVVRDLKRTLAMGADDAILLDDPAFEDSDSFATAYTLAMAIKKIGEYDLILCGIQAADWNAGQVGLGISEILGLPAVTSVTKIEAGDGCVEVQSIIDNGFERLELPLPCVVGVGSDETLMPRIAPLPRIIKAKRRKIPTWTATDLDADISKMGISGSLVSMEELAIPELVGECEFIKGEDLEAAAVNLAERLRNEQII